MHKGDGAENYVRLIDDLLAHDAALSTFLRALLTKLGLKVSPEDSSSQNDVNGKGNPELTPIHISSTSEALNRALYESLVILADDPLAPVAGNTFSIRDTNDVFYIKYLESAFESMRELGTCLEEMDTYSQDIVPKLVYFHSAPMTYRHFSSKEYFKYLPSNSKIGQSLAYVEVTSSTQTLLDKNSALLHTLPSGFVITATSQVNGRGRAGNAWISPRGSLPFSFIIHLPLNLSSRLVFVQYLVSLAVVEAIRTYDEGWEDVDVCIKWPNDVYGKPRGEDRWEKIGGIIVNSTYLEKQYVLVVGTWQHTVSFLFVLYLFSTRLLTP